jgi:hypothetical protein
MLGRWELYTGRQVRVRAIYTEEVVQERLYDPSCPQAGEVAVQWPQRLPRHMKGAMRGLRRLVAEDSQKRAWVVFDGVYRGPEPYKESEVPSNLPPPM